MLSTVSSVTIIMQAGRQSCS